MVGGRLRKGAQEADERVCVYICACVCMYMCVATPVPAQSPWHQLPRANSNLSAGPGDWTRLTWVSVLCSSSRSSWLTSRKT